MSQYWKLNVTNIVVVKIEGKFGGRRNSLKLN